MASSYMQTHVENAALCCSICLDQFRDPRSLACLHTFCEECIHDFVTKQQSSGPIRNGIECPLCRKVTRLKDENVPPKLWSKIMPINFALQDVIETLAKTELSKQKDPNEICPTHGKQVEFYCTDERLLCCSTCAINKLKEGREVNEIKEIANEGTDVKTQTLQKQIHDLLLKLGNVKHFLNKQETDLQIQINLIDSEMKMIQEKIVEKIEDSRAVIMSEATGLRDKTFKLYDEQRQTATKYTDALENVKDEFNVAVQNNPPERLFITLRRLEDKINNLQTVVLEKLAHIPCTEVKLSIDKMVKVVLEDSRLRLGELVPQETAQTTDDLKDCRKMKLKKLAILDILTSSLDEKQPLYSGMDFLPDGRLALVDNANWKLLILNKQLHVIGRHQFSSHIFDVVAPSDYELYVTGARRIEKLLIETERAYARVSTTNLTFCPFSISLLSNDKFVIGTYRSSTPVRVLSKSGSETEFRVEFPEKQWKIDDSRCAYDENDKLLVLTDRYDHSVYIYDTKIRNEIRVKDERIVEPRGVAFGPLGCIFLCSRGTDSIVQLSRYGEVLCVHKLDMIYPCTICFSKDNRKLAVTNSFAEEKQLQILQISSAY